MHDNDPVTLEAEKQRNLANKQHATSTPISEAPGWNEHLASSSEAHVKVCSALWTLHTMNSNRVRCRPIRPKIAWPLLSQRQLITSSLGTLLRTGCPAGRLPTSESPSKDRLDLLPPILVSGLHSHRRSYPRHLLVDESKTKVKVKTEVYQEVLKDATPSEEAVCLSLNPIVPSVTSAHLFPQVKSDRGEV